MRIEDLGVGDTAEGEARWEAGARAARVQFTGYVNSPSESDRVTFASFDDDGATIWTTVERERRVGSGSATR